MKNLLFFKRQRVFKVLFLSIIAFLIVCLALRPEKYVKVTFDGIKLWAVSVLPSLLPYFFLTTLLTKSGSLSGAFNKFTPLNKKLFRLNGISAYAYFMSMLSGYPVGSKIVSDLYCLKLISKGQANRLAILSSTSGPLFIIGAVGVCMFENKTIGFIMYISHVVSVFITALLFRNYGENEDLVCAPLSFEKSDNLLYDSVYSSVISAIVVGGFVSVFFVLSQILIDFKILYPLELVFKFILLPLSKTGVEAKAFTAGLIEFTKGCNLLSKIATTPLTISLANFLITFGGVSVIAQSLAFLNKAKVNSKIFILSKLISAVICFTICYLLTSFFL